MFLNILFLFQNTATAGASFLCLLLWSFLPFLLGLVIGYWVWAKYKQLASDRESQVLRLKAKATEDEQSRIALSQKLDSSNSIKNKLKANLTACDSEKATLNEQLIETKQQLAETKQQLVEAKQQLEEKAVPPLAIVDEVPVEEPIAEEVAEVTEPEPIEEVVVEETKEEIAAPLAVASTMAAVAATAPKDKEDDYLPCKAYEGHSVNDKIHNIAFFKHDNGQYYFVLYNEEGDVRLRSEGFSSAKDRDQELSGVIRLKDTAEYYKRVSKGKYFMDLLYDETGREVGRSCLQKEQPVVEPEVVEAPVVVATPIVEEVQEVVEPEVQVEPEVIQRKVVRVKRTVNISGLEDLDGIDVGAQTRLINMGYPSMTALAQADEATLTRRFANTDLNWRYWWMQSKYAISGDWASYYSYQESGGTSEEKGVEVQAEKSVMKKAVKVIPTSSSKIASTQKFSYSSYFANTDLQIIDGVGPKLQGILSESGYTTWEAVANSSYDDLKRMLSNAGPRFRIHDPRSWARQAQLANEGKWEDLVAYQKFLNQSTVGTESFSKVEKLMNRHLGFTNAIPTDLKIIEGIGPKIEALLKAAGINNWTDLSRATTDKLKLVLQNGGNRYRLADPSTWPTQASLAVKEEWTKLKEYQELL